MMNKKLLYILIFLQALSVLTSCKNDLNVAPQNIIQSSAVFSSQTGVEAYLASLYSDLHVPMEDFNTHPSSNPYMFMPDITDEAMNRPENDANSIGGGTSLGWWGYTSVRNVDQFIEQVKQAAFPADQINEWLGEALFIRAYYYWAMVKRYGGVPLVTSVQNYTGNNLDELQVPRNTEKEVYDFIANQLDSSAMLLGETSEVGRANKYAAYALKSRAMLYAASEAEYGTEQLNGLLGMPADEANTYWQMAYDAAQKIISSGKYSLYNKNPDDKSANFSASFLDDASTENIFIEQFSYPNKAHSYDLFVLPHGGDIGSSVGYGSCIDPTLELVESYEYTDGSDGKLKLTDASGNPIQYANPYDLFKNKDPRLDATILLPFGVWKGYTLDVRAGIIDDGQTISSGDYNTLYKGQHIIGLYGIGGDVQISQTGFYTRKYLQPSYDRTLVASGTSSQSFQDFRYDEILLNYAEAAIELGKVADAQTAINLIRSRAGISLLSAGQVTVSSVRHERQVELALEPFRYWDIRRWRIADQVLNNTQFTALLPYLVLSNNTYEFKTKKVGYPKIFTSNMYYERIDPGEISKNPKLIQNTGY